MSTILFFIFGFLGTVIATFLGGILAINSLNLPKKLINIVQNFSVGSIIGLIFFEFFHHSVEGFLDLTNITFLNYLYPFLIIFGTGLVFLVLHELLHLISHHHDHHPDDKDDSHDHGHTVDVFNDNKSILLASFIFLGAIVVHNIPEGFSFGIIFNEVNEAGVPVSGLIMSLIMLIHNCLIGFSMTISFKKAEKTNVFSLTLVTLSSLLSYILSIIGFYSGVYISDLPSSIIMAIATGSLLYVLFIELLPEVFYKYKSKFSFIYILLGLVITGLLLVL